MLAVPQGQSGEEVASLIVEITETDQPHLRYQTSESMRQYVAEILVDPTGNEVNQGNIRFLNRIIADKK